MIAWWSRSIADRTKSIMTNSSRTAECEKDLWKPEGLLCSPPVNVEELSSIDGERGKVVLTVSRIDRGKRVTEILEVAKLVPEADFYL